MDVQVLGPVEASADGRSIPLGGGKPRALLAMLALNAGSTVSTERLIDGLWGEQPPASANKLVQVYVSQLRKALGSSGDGAEIVTRRHGYEPFAGAEIRRLEELRLAALELAIDRDLEEGRHRDVVGELEPLVAAEPLRERLHALRMLALYRCGRQADALAAYRQARSALVDAIGVEPGAELRRLHEAILRQDRSLEPPVAEPVELPVELEPATPLIGRGAELDWLREQWRTAHGGTGRLVLVAGARGIGKTRLAAALAADVHRDRAAVLYGSGAGAPDAVLSAIAGVGAARRPTLVVLDDLDRAGEAVLGALAELAGKLATLPVLVLATAEDAPLAADATLSLAPLDLEAVRAVGESYAATPTEAAELLLRESGGMPQRVHRLAAEWASAATVRRLDVAASRATAERAGLRATEDELAGDVVQLRSLRARAESRDIADPRVTCPFKGLASFDVDDAEFFFGRERLVAEMVARLVGAPLMGIVGPSGSGKSSALRAGLLPALAGGVLPGSEGWTQIVIRPGEQPLEELRRMLVSGARDPLAEALDGLPADERLLLAVDQLEELFTACRSDAERAAFADTLARAAADPEGRAVVVVALRADFYGRFAAFPELADLLGGNHVLVGPMQASELRRAVELPAGRVGLRVEPELADALVDDVEGEPGALPLLSTALLELWQKRQDNALTLAAYRESGGVHGAVARLAEATYARVPHERRQHVRAVMLRLVGEGEGEGGVPVRRRASLAEL